MTKIKMVRNVSGYVWGDSEGRIYLPTVGGEADVPAALAADLVRAGVAVEVAEKETALAPAPAETASKPRKRAAKKPPASDD